VEVGFSQSKKILFWASFTFNLAQNLHSP